MTAFVGWEAWFLATAIEAGTIGTLLLLADRALRRAGKDPPSRWTAALILLALLRFLVPGLLTTPGLSHVALSAPGVSGGDAAGWFLPAFAAGQVMGLLVGLAYLVRSGVRLRRTLGRAERALDGPAHDALRQVACRLGMGAPPLYLTDGAGPAAVGLIRSAILLPAGLVGSLDPAGLRMVLAHEAAHVRRRDPLAAGIRTLAVSIWWAHPVAWALAFRHRTAAEDACDDAVLETGVRPADYCATLLECAAAGTSADGGGLGTVAMGLGGHPLGRRFRRLFRMGRRGRPGAGPSRSLLAAVLTAAALTLPVRVLGFETATDSRVVRQAPTDESVVRHVIRDVRTTHRVID